LPLSLQQAVFNSIFSQLSLTISILNRDRQFVVVVVVLMEGDINKLIDPICSPYKDVSKKLLFS
jgi:hypothetical protein